MFLRQIIVIFHDLIQLLKVIPLSLCFYFGLRQSSSLETVLLTLNALSKAQLSRHLFIIKVTVPSRLLPATPVIHFISAKSLKEISLQQYVIFPTGYEMRPVTPCRFYFKHFFSGEAAIIPRFNSLST